jgi:xylulokinase
MYLLGLDIGSSSVKASLLDGETGKCLSSAFSPAEEMSITAKVQGWAEQEPRMWWENLVIATREALSKVSGAANKVGAIGISYQMHGLVMIDKNKEVIRPSIIWCDSRAVSIGEKAFHEIGETHCLSHLLNSPGNFTASKLKWVKENEPSLYDKLWKVLLPGDYIAMKLTGEVNTTVSGLSEGIFWDFAQHAPARFLLNEYGFKDDILPEITGTFSEQGRLSAIASSELGLAPGIPVTYRAGDQPNNAFSLNVLNPGEVAATAGTSGVVYGVSEEIRYDNQSRVNTFAHVNHDINKTRLGVLLCVNGAGILNSWSRRNIFSSQLKYSEIDQLANTVPVGSDGLVILPFGNGAERLLGNQDLGAKILNLNFNIHQQGHLARAAQEGIVFAFWYGMKIMKETGINPRIIRAGNANMFYSDIFRDTLAGVSGASIELFETDGAQGAARGAGLGQGYYKNYNEAFTGLTEIKTIDPDSRKTEAIAAAYQHWENQLAIQMSQQ